jgi:acetyl esterase/lipase
MNTPLTARWFVLMLAAVGGLLSVSAPVRAATAEERPAKGYTVTQALDLRYFDGRDRQTLDVFAPKGVKNRPVLIFVHGGAWFFGDKNFFGIHRAIGPFLARNGVVTVVINYRLSPHVKHPEHVKDVARAFAWVRRHIADYGGDPDRIFLCGHSAGAHLVSLLATDEQYLKDPDLGLKAADRAALRGVVAVSGVYRIPTPDDCARVVGDMLRILPTLGDKRVNVALSLAPLVVRHTPGLSPFPLIFGSDPAVCKTASPLAHVHKGLPPFLVLYAECELPLLGEMAVDFGKALADAGVEADVQRVGGCSHATILLRLYRKDDTTSATLLKFIDQHARPSKQ